MTEQDADTARREAEAAAWLARWEPELAAFGAWAHALRAGVA